MEKNNYNHLRKGTINGILKDSNPTLQFSVSQIMADDFV